MAINSIIYIKGTNTLKTKCLRLTQEEIDSLYYHVSIKEIEIELISSQQGKYQA